jgi:hypothetical protein
LSQVWCRSCLWGSRTSAVLSSSSVVVFVDQTAEDLSSAHHAAGGTQLNRATLSWRSLFERAMRPVRVVVGRVLGQHVHELPLVEDQHPVQAFAANDCFAATDDRDTPASPRSTTTYRYRDPGQPHCAEATTTDCFAAVGPAISLRLRRRELGLACDRRRRQQASWYRGGTHLRRSGFSADRRVGTGRPGLLRAGPRWRRMPGRASPRTCRRIRSGRSGR